jgi:glycosyltransferase involved in cell wall biosynthesis
MIFCASTVHNSKKQIELGDALYKEDKIDGIPFVFIKTSQYAGNGFSRVKNMLTFARNLKKVALRLAKRSKPDVILASSVHPFTAVAGIFAAKRLKIPCIVEIRDLWPESIVEYMRRSKKNPVIQALYWLEKWIYEKADRLIFTMEGGADYIREKGWDKSIDMTKVFHINNGVDLAEFDIQTESCKISDQDLDDASAFKVVYAGSLRNANGIGRILDVAKELGSSNARFLLWGGGEDEEELRRRIADEGIGNVCLKGRAEKEAVAGILAKSDLNLLNYERHAILRFGGSQNKLFEYFASGKPILSTNKTGYDLIAKYGAGIVVDSGRPQDIADAILRMAALPKETYDEYCENARKAAMDYDYRNLTEKLIGILEGFQKYKEVKAI